MPSVRLKAEGNENYTKFHRLAVHVFGPEILSRPACRRLLAPLLSFKAFCEALWNEVYVADSGVGYRVEGLGFRVKGLGFITNALSQTKPSPSSTAVRYILALSPSISAHQFREL